MDEDCLDIECTLCCDGSNSQNGTTMSRFYSSFPQREEANPSSSSSSTFNIANSISTSLGFGQPQTCCEQFLSFCETDLCFFCPMLTFSQRLYSFIICAVLAFFLSMGSFFKFNTLLEGNPIPFVVQYTVGIILSMASTCILYGPLYQLRTMFHSTRMMTSIVYLTLMVIIIAYALSSHPLPFLLVFLIFGQYLALTWYSLSFIPWGREAVWSLLQWCCGSCITKEEWEECLGDEANAQNVETYSYWGSRVYGQGPQRSDRVDEK